MAGTPHYRSMKADLEDTFPTAEVDFNAKHRGLPWFTISGPGYDVELNQRGDFTSEVHIPGFDPRGPRAREVDISPPSSDPDDPYYPDFLNGEREYGPEEFDRLVEQTLSDVRRGLEILRDYLGSSKADDQLAKLPESPPHGNILLNWNA